MQLQLERFVAGMILMIGTLWCPSGSGGRFVVIIRRACSRCSRFLGFSGGGAQR
jgi:hypothetical protein